jgi:DNA gyrase/topoisomerase IV subunit A
LKYSATSMLGVKIKKLNKVAVNIESNIEEFLKTQNQILTRYDIMRIKQIKQHLSIIIHFLQLIDQLFSTFKHSNSNENFKDYVDPIIRNSIAKIKNLLVEPFNFFPDVSLWMLHNGQRVGNEMSS